MSKSLENLSRFRPVPGFAGVDMIPHPGGEWVQVSEVEEMFDRYEDGLTEMSEALEFSNG